MLGYKTATGTDFVLTFYHAPHVADKISKVAPDSDEDIQPQIELVNKKN